MDRARGWRRAVGCRRVRDASRGAGRPPSSALEGSPIPLQTLQESRKRARGGRHAGRVDAGDAHPGCDAQQKHTIEADRGAFGLVASVIEAMPAPVGRHLRARA